ncbi:pro-interleukin-16-like isoform X1 [Stegostoma tigrinum]|uniref:pro-interleukin-16-like isoform X1 n=1 Tax=Stegostoma tigrinum TaxID=3053191 RepID=UPI0028707CA0|nr:pro-interleukin-16-like isoform X1 [Stegostoma tigrinum]
MVRRRCSWKEEARCLPSASDVGLSDTAGGLGPGSGSDSDSGPVSSSGSVPGLGPGGRQHSRHSEGLRELGCPLPLGEGESQDTTVSLGLTASSPLSESPQCEVVISPFLSSDDEASLSDSSAVNSNSDVVLLDKSYSISLAELRDCGIELREDGQKGEQWNHSASLRSNLSSMSVVSLIPNDELERLLSEVKGLEEESIQCPEDVRVVVLHKDEGTGLGFSIAGGQDHTNRMVTVHKVFPNGLAAQEGTIERGDEVLSINGNLLKDISHSEALSHLHKVRPSKQAIVVIRKVPESERATPCRERSTARCHWPAAMCQVPPP